MTDKQQELRALLEETIDELQALALASERIKELTDGKEIVKVIVVPKKLVNIVVKG